LVGGLKEWSFADWDKAEIIVQEEGDDVPACSFEQEEFPVFFAAS